MKGPAPRKTIVLLSGFLWFLSLVVVSLMPEQWKGRLHTHGRLHLPVHFAAFAFSGLLVFGAVKSAWKRAALGFALLLVGFTLEALQQVIYTISFEWGDLGADALGLGAAFLVSALWTPAGSSQRNDR